MKKLLAVLLAVVMMFTFTAVTVSASSTLTDSQTELGEAYCEFFNSMAAGSVLECITIAVTDIPLSWFDVITDIGDVLWVGDDIYYYLVGDDLYISRGGAGGRVCYSRSGGGGASRDDVHVTGDVLSDLAQMYNDHYGPKTAKEYISWRTDHRYAEVTENYSAPRLSFFTDGYFCGETQWNEVYLVPWYTDGTTDYFSQYQFHFYQVSTKNDNGTRVITMYFDVWDMLNGGDVQTVIISDKLMDYRYIDFCISTEENRLLMFPYASYTQYLQHPRQTTCCASFGMSDRIGKNIMYSSDLATTVNIGTYLGCWQKAVSAHDEGTCEFGCGHDTGYYCSDKQIYMNFDFIDTTKLTEDDVITLSGDTFYDYTITNSTTGDSSTVYNYITNNYTYPETDNGDSDDSGEEGSGSASGDVNVSGNIDVGGSVDVNVNVNNNGSADGGSMPVDVNLENYLEQTPEQAKPITDFFAIFFDFLPAELLGLICLGVVVAIILRVWGR